MLTILRGTGLLEALAEEVARKLGQGGGGPASPDAWVSQKDSPLGRRKHLELCRTGALAGARKAGKSWLVRRAVVDAWIETQGGPAPVMPVQEEHDLESAVERAAAEAGLVRVAPSSSSRAARRGAR